MTPVQAAIEVSVGDSRLRLPRTCFEDLAEVRYDSGIALARAEAGVCLTLRGGDAGGSYYARFFPSGAGIARCVELGELPDLVFERARWDNAGNLIAREYRNDVTVHDRQTDLGGFWAKR